MKDFSKLTINERASYLARIVESTRTELTRVFMVHHGYFINNKGKRPTNEVCKRFSVILPHLNQDWLFLGEGEIWNDNVRDDISDLLKLVRSSRILELLADTEATDAVLQFLIDNDVDTNAFIARYGAAYPALSDIAPVHAPAYVKSIPFESCSRNEQESSGPTTAQLMELLANQQMLNKYLQDEIVRLNSVITDYLKSLQNGNNQ